MLVCCCGALACGGALGLDGGGLLFLSCCAWAETNPNINHTSEIEKNRMQIPVSFIAHPRLS